MFNTNVRRPLHLAGLWLALAWASAWGQSSGVATVAVPTEPQLRIEAGMHTAPVRRIDTDAQGRWAATASLDKTARVWDIASGRLLQVLRPPLGPGNEGKLYAVAVTPDGSTVVVAGWTGWDWGGQVQIYVFDRSSGQLQRRLTGAPSVINQLSFSPDGRWLAATFGGANGVRVWDWRGSGAALSDNRFGADSHGASWSRDGRLVVSSYDGKLRLYRPAAATPGGNLTPLATVTAAGGKQPVSVSFHPDGTRIAVGYADSPRVDMLDGQTLAPLPSPSTQGVAADGTLESVAWSRDGQTLAAAGRWSINSKHSVRLWQDAGRGPSQDIVATGDTVLHMAPLPAGGWLVAGADPAWGVLGASGPWSLRGAPPTADLRDGRGNAFMLAGGATRVQFGFEPFGKPPHRFDVLRRTLEAGPLPDGTAADIAGLPVTNWINRIDPLLRGQPVKLEPYEKSRSLAISPGGTGFVLGADFRLRYITADGTQRWDQPVPGVVWGVNIPTDGPQAGKLVVATYGDGTIRWYRLDNGQELLALFPHADRKRWVLWTPSGYYDASPGGEDLIGWHINRGQQEAADFFPASRFRTRFYRPDIIDRVLETLDENQALKDADLAGNRRSEPTRSVAQVLPPVVEVASGAELRANTQQVTVRVRARAADDAPVTAWRIRVNGQLVREAGVVSTGTGGAGGPGSRAATAIVNPGEREFVVPIPPQDSRVEVFAENRHGVSSAAVVSVTWAGAGQGAGQTVAGAGARAPDLYVLAVGVGAYTSADISKLGFPAKDARDFAAALQQQKGKLYRRVEVKLLTDAQATRDEVVDGLEWLQRSVGQYDVAMVFIAGHAINDPNQGYTFLPFNADLDRLKRTGVSRADVLSTLAGMPGKALFFFDTCHAGNATGGRRGMPNDVSGIVNELASAENGVVVFASSTGRQFSYEDPKWNNGAFTKALVEGLNGAAAAGSNARITHGMLSVYVSDRVKQLTGGKQSPVTQSPTGSPDFPVAVR